MRFLSVTMQILHTCALNSSKQEGYSLDKTNSVGYSIVLSVACDSKDNFSTKNSNSSGYLIKKTRRVSLFFKGISSGSVLLLTPNIRVINEENKSVAEFLTWKKFT